MAKNSDIITCIKCEPNANAVVCELKTDLKSMQEAVGGYIEFTYPFPNDVFVLCNEEGKLCGLKPSRPLLDENNVMYDYIAGTCYIIGSDELNNGYRSLTDEEIKHYLKLWKYPIKLIKWILPKTINDDGFGVKTVIDFEPFNGDTGRKVKAYGR